MKTIKLKSFEELGSYERRLTGRPRRRFLNTRLNAQQVKPGQEYELTLDQRLRRKREEVRQLIRLEQPTSKQAVQIFIFGDPVLYRIEDLQAVQSSGWHYTIVEVGFETITKRW